MMNSQTYKSVDELVWFGDSWPAGVGISNTKLSFPYLVGNSLDIHTLNYANAGSSIPDMVQQVIRWRNYDYDSSKNYILIACLTSENRFSWKPDDNDKWFTIAPWAVDKSYDFNEDVKKFYMYSYNQEAVEFYNKCCVGYLKNLCNEINVPLYLLRNFKGMDEEHRSHSLLDNGLVQFLLDDLNAEWSVNLKKQISATIVGKGLFTKCVHPNIYGHKKIANILTDKLRGIIKTN